MAKEYLSRQERETLGLMSQLGTIAKLRLLDKGAIPKGEESKYLSLSITYFTKFIGQLGKRCPKATSRMISDFRDCEIKYVAKNMINRKEEEAIIKLGESSVRKIAEGCMVGNCSICVKSKEEAEKCTLRDIFINADVPPLEEDGVCPYRYEEQIQHLCVKFEGEIYKVAKLDQVMRTVTIMINGKLVLLDYKQVKGIGMIKRLGV